MEYRGLKEATLIRRVNRFVAEVALDDGRVVTAHVPNTGSMLSTKEPGSPVAISHCERRGRKHEWTLELVKPEGCAWVGVNTMRTNRIVEEAIRDQKIPQLRGYDDIRCEVRRGRSRIDLLLESGSSRCFVEIKNVTYRVDSCALFPDAVTERGAKHLRELTEIALAKDRAVIFFLVNRGDCTSMRPASNIDPEYARTLREAVAHGVEALAYRAQTSPIGVHIDKELTIEIG